MKNIGQTLTSIIKTEKNKRKNMKFLRTEIF